MPRVSPWLNGPRISAGLLRGCFYYATVFGVATFRIGLQDDTSKLRASSRKGYKWLSILIRVLGSCFYGYSYGAWADQYTDWYLRLFFGLRLVGCLVCSVIILVLQVCYEKRILHLVNSFFGLFRRLRALTRTVEAGFGGSLELTLLMFKLLSLAFVFVAFQWQYSPWVLLTIVCDLYTSIGTGMIMHFCFVGYLSIGILYAELNRYVDHQLRAQLSSLQDQEEEDDIQQQPDVQAHANLDECLAIYEEIHQVTCSFQRLFDLPLFLTLVQNLSAMAMVSYHAIMSRDYHFSLWGLVLKLLIDVLLLTLAVHGAVSGSRLVRRLSLENYTIGQSKSYHIKFEIFLGRLNHQQLRVCPLGMFEVSNELTLFFLSAMVTYLTFLVQYGIQTKQF
ncbi:putative gustatory receptor 93b [Drosophila miranda]|uniref:putative gustatory receptor 93b n=1 Tax=Drosophila miranda TaxID=7229 RepID=UPI00143F6C03|nr:putative gustatory receptor 93b [Drosophila miranda]